MNPGHILGTVHRKVYCPVHARCLTCPRYTGINAVELDTKAQYFVGLGGLPNAEGVIEMDAAVMDGNSMSYGAVVALRYLWMDDNNDTSRMS